MKFQERLAEPAWQVLIRKETESGLRETQEYHLWGWIDGEAKFRLLPIVDREAFQQEGSKP